MTEEGEMGKTEERTGAGRTVVLIHGMWSRPHVWQNFRHFFTARGYRVVTPTLRHHDIERWMEPHPELATTSLLDYADDIEAEIVSSTTNLSSSAIRWAARSPRSLQRAALRAARPCLRPLIARPSSR
jgi:pimeloyl-ACP methyl ester carboxylesterase